MSQSKQNITTSVKEVRQIKIQHNVKRILMIKSGFMTFIFLAMMLPLALYCLPKILGKSLQKPQQSDSDSLTDANVIQVAVHKEPAADMNLMNISHNQKLMVGLIKLFAGLLPVLLLFSLWFIYVLVHGHVVMPHGVFLSAALVCVVTVLLYLKPTKQFQALKKIQVGDKDFTNKNEETSDS